MHPVTEIPKSQNTETGGVHRQATTVIQRVKTSHNQHLAFGLRGKTNLFTSNKKLLPVLTSAGSRRV
jgi:hypothetical protein